MNFYEVMELGELKKCTIPVFFRFKLLVYNMSHCITGLNTSLFITGLKHARSKICPV